MERQALSIRRRATRRFAVSVLTGVVLATFGVPVSAQTDPWVPATFTARIGFGREVRSGTIKNVDGRIESRDSVYAPVMMSVSDPRLDGDVLISWQTDWYPGTVGAEVTLGTGTWRIETADGVWEGSYTGLAADGVSEHHTAVLFGQGGYEGLVAVWEQTVDETGWDVVGVILPAGPPPVTVLP